MNFNADIPKVEQATGKIFYVGFVCILYFSVDEGLPTEQPHQTGPVYPDAVLPPAQQGLVLPGEQKVCTQVIKTFSSCLIFEIWME